MKMTTGKIAVAFGALALVAAACGTTEEATPDQPQMTEETSSVRVAHFSPDAPAVDVYVDGERVLSGVPFAAVSDYLEVPAGEHTFEVRPAGADADSEPVVEATATTVADQAYTVAAIGELSAIEPGLFADDLAAPDAGVAHVRALHAVPDVGPVDVNVKGVGTVIEGLAFGDSSPYLPVPAGEYTFRVRAAGTKDNLLTLTATLPAGTITTAAAVGSAAAGTARIEAYSDKS